MFFDLTSSSRLSLERCESYLQPIVSDSSIINPTIYGGECGILKSAIAQHRLSNCLEILEKAGIPTDKWGVHLLPSKDSEIINGGK